MYKPERQFHIYFSFFKAGRTLGQCSHLNVNKVVLSSFVFLRENRAVGFLTNATILQFTTRLPHIEIQKLIQFKIRKNKTHTQLEKQSGKILDILSLFDRTKELGCQQGYINMLFRLTRYRYYTDYTLQLVFYGFAISLTEELCDSLE